MFWFNNFQEFERKKNRENRLILNYYYVPSEGEKDRKIKVFAKKDVEIPTKFLYGDNVGRVKKAIKEHPRLRDFFLHERRVGKFSVLEIKIPYDNELIKELPSEFETGNYDKLLRLNVFYPEMKIAFPEQFEKLIAGKEEISIDNLEGFHDLDFITEEEMREMPWLYFDIEKPLWKKEHEKIWLKRRKRLLKDYKKQGEKNKERINRIVKRLEDRLTIEVEDAGKVKLWEEMSDATISSIAAIFKNCNGKWEEIKEVYILDPRKEFNKKKVKGYKIFGFSSEKELIKGFKGTLYERNPVFCSGHNVVYDQTQVRDAAKKTKQDYYPAVEDINPRRDFVRNYFQRLKEDLIYIDSMWMSSIFYPWLRQRSLGSNLKLESVAQFHGLDFAKSMSHEELRAVELQRLLGKTKKIRQEAAKRIFDYVCSDVGPVKHIIENSEFLSLITRLKRIMPYETLTEIAFHTNCVNKYHDYKHFQRAGNNRYYGYSQKKRENEIQIFKKRFASLKKQMLNWVDIPTSPIKGIHKDIYEIYLPFEEWIRESTFKWAPDFKFVYEKVEKAEKLAFLRYLNSLNRDMLVDYYFARREGRIFKDHQLDIEDCQDIEKIIKKEHLDSYYGSFDYLKNHFRSIYVDLARNERALIRPTKKNLQEIDFPEHMERDADLYLLRKNAEKIRPKLKPHNKRNLTSFLTNFGKFESLSKEIGYYIYSLDPDNSGRLLFLYNQHKRKTEAEKRFYAKYGQEVGNLAGIISNSYKRLKKELENHNAVVLDSKGDYLFVQADDSIKNNDFFYVVRELEEYEVK